MMPTAAPSLIAERSDTAELARRFAQTGRVRLDSVLTDPAVQRLLERVKSWPDWHLVTRVQGEHKAFEAAAMDQVPAPQRQAFDALVAAEARAGFQYLYERFPLYDRALAGDLPSDALSETFAALRGQRFLDLMRQVTGRGDIAFADGQLTRFRAGHFLTAHDDTNDRDDRVAAYVLNLSEDWTADMGGLLHFIGEDGDVTEGFTPRLNTLAVFAVPSLHAVSAVAPFADRPRYAITGWLRTGAEPGVPSSPA